MKKNEIIVQENCMLLDLLINEIKNKSRNNLKKIISLGLIKVNKKVNTKANFMLKTNDIVEIINKVVLEEEIEVIYEDKDIMVVNKPINLLTISTKDENDRTLYNKLSEYVKKKGNGNKVFIVHRLDKETSGILIFAKNERVKNMLQKSWNETVDVRKYAAVVIGKVDRAGIIKSYLVEGKDLRVYQTSKEEGLEAITRYSPIKAGKNFSLIELKLETGRKHQIRVQMSGLGYPVVGDSKYGVKSKEKRMYLHAFQIRFTHPITKKIMNFETEIPISFYNRLNK